MTKTTLIGGGFGIITVIVSLAVTVISLRAPETGTPGLLISMVVSGLSGMAAGYTAARSEAAPREERAAYGRRAGAISGLVAFIGSFAMLAALFGTGIMQQQLNSVLQSPDMASPGVDPAALVGVIYGLSVGISFCTALLEWMLMLGCGVLGGLLWKGAPTPMATYSR